MSGPRRCPAHWRSAVLSPQEGLRQRCDSVPRSQSPGPWADRFDPSGLRRSAHVIPRCSVEVAHAVNTSGNRNQGPAGMVPSVGLSPGEGYRHGGILHAGAVRCGFPPWVQKARNLLSFEGQTAFPRATVSRSERQSLADHRIWRPLRDGVGSRQTAPSHGRGGSVSASAAGLIPASAEAALGRKQEQWSEEGAGKLYWVYPRLATVATLDGLSATIVTVQGAGQNSNNRLQYGG
jgi:hypothetical protein